MSNKLIMPKQTAQLNAFFGSLKIFYDTYKNGEEWCSNAFYKTTIVELLPSLGKGAKDEPYLVKQSELTRYFGFAYHDYSIGATKITKTGIEMYEAFLNGDKKTTIDLIISSIFHDSFGRNNSAIKSSDSDIDPPKLFLKAISDLNGITINDFSYLLYLTNDMMIEYGSALAELSKRDDDSKLVPKEVSNKYKDIKFIYFLNYIGVITKSKDKKYRLSDEIATKYSKRLVSLDIYNKKPEQTISLIYQNNQQIRKEINDTLLTDLDQNEVNSSQPYDINSIEFEFQNNRVPEPGQKETSSRYKTNPRLAKTALEQACYLCESDNSHTTFIAKNGQIYMEAHHLIPMVAQKDIEINIDCIENIVSLCPTCHASIHYGNETTRYKMVEKLYQMKETELKKAGLNISLDELFEKYYK